MALDRVRWLTSVTPIFIISALVTIGTGIGLIVGLGGFSAVRGSVPAGALLAICAIPIGGAMSGPALLKLSAHFESGSAPAAAAPLVSRFLLAHRIEQTLRFAALLS